MPVGPFRGSQRLRIRTNRSKLPLSPPRPLPSSPRSATGRTPTGERYSCRRATMGSIAAARLAGIPPASSAARKKTAAAVRITAGSMG